MGTTMPKLTDFLTPDNRKDIEDLYFHLLEEEAKMQQAGIPVTSQRFAGLREAVKTLAPPSRATVITEPEMYRPLQTSETRQTPYELAQKETTSPLTYKGYLKSARDTKHLFETTPSYPTRGNYLKALQSAKSAGLDQPIMGMSYDEETGKQTPVTISKGIEMIKPKPLTEEQYKIQKVFRDFGISTDPSDIEQFYAVRENMPIPQREDFDKAISQLTSGKETEKDYKPETLVKFEKIRNASINAGYSWNDDDSTAWNITNIGKNLYGEERQGYYDLVNEVTKPTEEKELQSTEKELDKLYFETIGNLKILYDAETNPEKYSVEQINLLGKKLARHKDKYLKLIEELPEEMKSYWGSKFKELIPSQTTSAPQIAQPQATPQAITLPPEIKTTSQAVEYLTDQGMTEEQAVQWLRSQ